MRGSATRRWTASAIIGSVGLGIAGVGCLARPGTHVAVTSPSAEIVVAPWGADSNPGTLERPLATLEAARDALRSRLAEGARGSTVWLRGGTYGRTRPFLLDSRDSGTASAPVVYRAWPGERVALVGGIHLDPSAFEPVADRALLARIVSKQARPHVRQIDLRCVGLGWLDPIAPRGFPCPIRPAPPELFVGDRPMIVARWPNDGFVKTGKILRSGLNPEGNDLASRPIFEFLDDRPTLWAHARDLWLVGYWRYDWADEAIQVARLDRGRHRITLATPHPHGLAEGRPFYAENLVEEIDQPGEYVLDHGSGFLYFLPPADISEGPVALSTLTEPVVWLRDASHVRFRDLTIEVSRGDGILIEGGTDVRIESSTLRNLGNRAVVVEGGTGHAVVGCEIHDTGEGGIVLNGGDRATLRPAGHLADDNHIFRFSRRGATYRPAIAMHGVGSHAAHNLIHDAPHSAILFWGNDHVIEFNEIHHVLQRTGDGGAVYTGLDWTFRGNVVRYNFFHDLWGLDRVESAVYIDDQAGGITIAGNIFHRCHWGMLLGGGRDIRVENNVFSECKLALQLDARGLGWGKGALGPTLRERLAAMPYATEPWAGRYPELVNIEAEEPMAPRRNVLRRNVLYRCGAIDARIDPTAREQAVIEENLETDQDPGFVDPARLDFRFRPDATVRTALPGFQPIPVDQIGLRHE